MNSAGQFDITIEQGATFNLPLQLFDDDNEPVSLAGATIRAKVRNDVDDAAAILTFTCNVTGAATGECEVTATAAETAALVLPASPPKKRPLTKYLWDMEAVYSDGVVQRVLEGFCFVSPEVSK